MLEWVQVITRFNPVSYFIEVRRMVMLKGNGLSDIRFQIFAMIDFAVFLMVGLLLIIGRSLANLIKT